MKYLITGGNSFLGQALTRRLLSEGHEVIIACRKTSACDNPDSERVQIVRYKDLSDIFNLTKKVDYADVFVHLAWGGTDHIGRNSQTVQKANIKYSIDALTVAKAFGCKLFVEAGSQAEYGVVKDLITEETPCHPVTEYGRAKLEFGQIAERWCEKNNMKFIHLRIFSIFGVHDHARTLVMSSIKKMLRNEDIQLSSCRQMWNFVDEDDAAHQIYLLTVHAVDNPFFKSEIYNIGSYDTRRLRSFVNEMSILTQTKSKLHFGALQLSTASLDPCMDKTASATGGFVNTKTFGSVIKNIIAVQLKIRYNDH